MADTIPNEPHGGGIEYKHYRKVVGVPVTSARGFIIFVTYMKDFISDHGFDWALRIALLILLIAAFLMGNYSGRQDTQYHLDYFKANASDLCSQQGFTKHPQSQSERDWDKYVDSLIVEVLEEHGYTYVAD